MSAGPRRRPHRAVGRRHLVAVALLAVAVSAAVIAFRARTGAEDPLTGTTSLLEQEASFDSSREAVQSFAAVYEGLAEATADLDDRCDVDSGRARCLALHQAAAWSLTFSTAAGGCTQPAIQAGRLALLDYVTRAADLAEDATAGPGPLPPIPRC